MGDMNNNLKYILKIENVNKTFPGVKALDDVSLKIRTGTIHALVGENGAGKSTLMKILSGVYTKDSGKITFNDKVVETTNPSQSMQDGLSIIYQELNLVDTMTVGENIFLGRFTENGGLKGVINKGNELLRSIGAKFTADQKVSDLSVSEKQMVEIAKALSYEARLIIMDEPSSSLTIDEMKQLTKIIHNLKNQGVTIIYISHKLDEIFDFCDYVTVLRDGAVIETKPISDITRNSMVASMVGRTIENEYLDVPDTVDKSQVVLEVNNLNSHKLTDINFELYKGEILGFVGLVGAGRTEIVRAIFGADKVKNIDLKILGEAIKISNPGEACEAGIGFVSEDRKKEGLILDFSVEENIALANYHEVCPKGIYDKKRQSNMAKRQVESLKVKTPSIKTRVLNLSGGNQQKCIIGRWLERDLKILIMDEPTRGIDVGAKYEIYLLMNDFVQQGGSIILISSELNEVLNLSHRVLTISEGKITGEFDPKTYSANEIMSSALGYNQESE